MSDESLKRCPICGRNATVHSWWSSKEECGVASVGCSRESYTNGYECARIHVMRIDERTARKDAIKIWNTRVELGGETCNPVETATLENATAHVMECDMCGCTYEHVNGGYPRCPHCGRKAGR